MKQRIQIKSVLEKKLKTILEYFGTLPGLSRARIVVPQGAFYLFPDVTAYFGLKTAAGKVVANDVELAEYILESSGVVCIPGSKFGKEGHLRLAFAAISEEKMKTGIQKLSDTLAKLS